MVSPIEIVILRLRELGFFEFLLPFMLSSAVFYGLLRKSQLFGPPERNVAVNAVVSLMVAFMIWAYPIIVGVSLEEKLSTFFVQGTIAMLVVIFGVSMVGVVFPEGLAKTLSEKWKGGGLYVVMILSGILVFGGLLLTSGLTEVFFPAAVGIAIPWDVILTVIMIAILGAVVFAIAVAGAAPPKEEKGT